MTAISIHSKTTAQPSLKVFASGGALLGLTFFICFQQARILIAAAGASGG